MEESAHLGFLLEKHRPSLGLGTKSTLEDLVDQEAQVDPFLLVNLCPPLVLRTNTKYNEAIIISV